MVFGVFDGIHEGHRDMFKEAKSCGDYLIAVLPQDHIVKHLKGHLPAINFKERMAHLQEEDFVDEVVAGDSELGTWGVIKKHRPEVIAVGYDQTALKQSLEVNFSKIGYRPEIKVMQSFEPNVYHSSLLKK